MDLKTLLFIMLGVLSFVLVLLIIFLFETIEELERKIKNLLQFQKRADFFEKKYYGMIEEYKKIVDLLHIEQEKNNEGSLIGSGSKNANKEESN